MCFDHLSCVGSHLLCVLGICCAYLATSCSTYWGYWDVTLIFWSRSEVCSDLVWSFIARSPPSIPHHPQSLMQTHHWTFNRCISLVVVRALDVPRIAWKNKSGYGTPITWCSWWIPASIHRRCVWNTYYVVSRVCLESAILQTPRLFTTNILSDATIQFKRYVTIDERLGFTDTIFTRLLERWLQLQLQLSHAANWRR